ncbi:MAG: type I 3-dehydroquinate dehydratase [Methanomicrobiaceae archaeon]|nr:type I 3-dehydroquinate dehydratase [Methanomicrobiaceae archaeon]
MKTVASISSLEGWRLACASPADLIEIRLDLLEDRDAPAVQGALIGAQVPVILTQRSAGEGGRFSGSVPEWQESLGPWLEHACYVDCEIRYRDAAVPLRDAGATIIASVHRDDMPPLQELEQLEADLRTIGEIPKIVITPQSLGDVIDLLAFTKDARKPIATGVRGREFRFARALLPLFGSELVYCHAGKPTAEGQYGIGEIKLLLELLE